MWDVNPAPGEGIWTMIRERFFSFGMVLAVGFLLLVSWVVNAALAAMGKFFDRILPPNSY
jgi:membrane protein